MGSIESDCELLKLVSSNASEMLLLRFSVHTSYFKWFTNITSTVSHVLCMTSHKTYIRFRTNSELFIMWGKKLCCSENLKRFSNIVFVIILQSDIPPLKIIFDEKTFG